MGYIPKPTDTEPTPQSRGKGVRVERVTVGMLGLVAIGGGLALALGSWPATLVFAGQALAAGLVLRVRHRGSGDTGQT